MLPGPPPDQLPRPQSQSAARTRQPSAGNSSISRIHITGASGSGVSTLGVNLAVALSLPVFDVDSYYWLPTNPPFTTKRPIDERTSLLKVDLERAEVESGGWVLSGSMVPWGEEIIKGVQHVIFVDTETDIRMKRLREREFKRHGNRVYEGGDMYEKSVKFLAWAEGYENPDSEGTRSRVMHEKWLGELTVPLTTLSGGENELVVLNMALESLERNVKTGIEAV